MWRVTADGDESILGRTTKMKHLKSIKAVFLNEFPIHKLWKYELFFKRETRRFSDMCDRKRVIHPSEQEVERKSIPLSRKLESSRDLIRAKNLKESIRLTSTLIG